MRIGEPLNLRPDQLDAQSWGALTNDILEASRQAMNQRIEHLVGESGQITKDLDGLLSRLTPPYSEHEIFWLLLQIPQGSRATFDRRTHRRMLQRTNRLTYVYHAAHFLEDLKPDQISEQVLQHLELAQQTIWQAWGQIEFNRLAKLTLSDLEEETRRDLSADLEIEESSPILNLTLSSLDADQRLVVSDALGRRVVSNVYRQLLLGVITELWVEYLTQMEALRVSIGL